MKATTPSVRQQGAVDCVIEMRGLSKCFSDLVAVDALDLDVHRGEVFGYLGPNGSGKSTTIRMLFDFIRPSAGTYTVLGGSGADPAIRRRLGYIPGELRFDPKYTTADLIAFYGRLRGGIDMTYAHELLERFDLDPMRPIGQLSTGNRRKTAIVQAFMHRPELLILDEPTAGLDPLLQHEFHQLIGDVKRDGTTVFLSSHVLPEVEALADRVAILKKGTLVTVAAIDDLQRQARQHIDLYLACEANAEPFEKLPGVLSATSSGAVIALVIEGNVADVLKHAATLPVRRIVTHETDLEDVFLNLYRDQP